ncbi:ketopantoate reductase family protein [Desulfogranum japonicum]|uniref:ketopantoate reductase family protein n=1 Tax=Desulfogranum japonicum TaxID=231447 RepID=UPI0003FED1F5|nr:2-dehydropantoate 2-reductase [Desulfogranum japonicum]
MHIVIVGGGAIGRFFGAYFCKGGNQVTLIDTNSEVVDELNKNGIGLVRYIGGPQDTEEHFSVCADTDGKKIQQCDLILLTVKSFATRSAAENVAHLVRPESPIIFMQTGLGNQAILREMFPAQAILAGLTFVSATGLGNAKIRQGRSGTTYLGELGAVGELAGQVTPRLEKICKVFTESGIEARCSGRIIGRLWGKVITYAALNSLTSILRVPNGKLLEDTESLQLARELIAEGEAVAQARGVEPFVDDLFEQFQQICKESSNNLSSMLQDIINNKKTEIDAQSGTLVKYAEKFGMQAPRHAMMTSILHLLEKWSVEP